METNLLTQIVGSLQTIGALAGVILSGTILTYFILPHIAGHIHASLMHLLWITLLIGVYVFYIGPEFVDKIVLYIMYGQNIVFYRAIPQEYAQNLYNTELLMISLYIVKLALYPSHHHKNAKH